jgi:hypothetical protein
VLLAFCTELLRLDEVVPLISTGSILLASRRVDHRSAMNADPGRPAPDTPGPLVLVKTAIASVSNASMWYAPAPNT